MDPIHPYISHRTSEISDPAMAPIKSWIESYVVWTELPKHTRASILKRASKGEAEAIEALCNHNLRLVFSRACKQTGRGVPLPDLIQEGWFGLRLAAQKYEPKRGTQFSTVAVYWIDQKLSNAIVTQGRTIYLPHHASERLTRISRMVQQGEALREDDQQWMDSLARERLGNPDLVNVSFDRFEYLLRSPASIDKPVIINDHVAQDQRTLADILPAPASADPSDALDFGVLLPQLVNRGALHARDAWMLIRFYGLDGGGGRDMPEIAQELFDAERRAGVNPKRTKPMTREAVRQCLLRAVRVLRQHLGASETNDTRSFVLPPANGTLREQTKRLSGASSAGQSESTESPKTRSTRNTSVNDLSQETVASRAATPTPLRAKSSTKRAKRSSRHSQVSGVDVPYAEAI